ncbi:MAG: CBS domain-containing protein [Desulfobacterium sp.]|nr:CBS domain-containing protein [Desulfobacterium sp.]
MKTNCVKDLMVPLSDYATVTEDASLFDVVQALTTAQENFCADSKYPHMAVIIIDKDGKAAGKVGQLDVLKALEPKYREMLDREGLAKFGFSRSFMKSLLTNYHLWDSPLRDICIKGSSIPVSTFMHTPASGEFIEEDATLDEAIHQLLLGQHRSLLVMKDGVVTGVIRLTDVFDSVARVIGECSLG